MNQAKEVKAGCEDHLYRQMNCCLHPCSVLECPEPICAADFPGGVKAFLRYKEMRAILESTNDINDAASKLSLTPQTVQRRYNKIKSLT